MVRTPTRFIASTVPAREIGVASSVLALARNIAGAFGIALFGTLLHDSIENNVLEIARYSVVRSANPADFGRAIGLIILKAQVAAGVTPARFVGVTNLVVRNSPALQGVTAK